MGKLGTFVGRVNEFAEQVGEDIADLRQQANGIINDSSASLSTTYSSSKIEEELDKKVDKEPGKGLSQENFTTAEKDKLAGLEGSKWKGTYTSLNALEASVQNPEPGNYADVDTQGEDVVRYIWDDTDDKWVPQQSGTGMTAAQIKSMYESNPDTNAFTDSEKSKLAGIEDGAEKNTVHSVAGKTGNVTLVKGDVGLSNVQNFGIATKAEAESGTTSSKYMTPQRAQDYVDKQVGDDNPLLIYNTAAGN